MNWVPKPLPRICWRPDAAPSPWWAERWTNPCRPLVRCEPKGYLSAFAERGVTPDLNLIRECGEWTSAEGAQAVREMYAQGIRPDGILR